MYFAYSSEEGHTRILIHANDTDVLVLCIAFFHTLSLDELWIAFAQGKRRRYVPVHAICEHFADKEMMTALPIFHALTGSDTSFLAGIGKKTAFQRWMTTPELTSKLLELLRVRTEADLTNELITALESFVVSLYSTSCPHSDLNKAQHYLFAKGARSFESLPPTSDAFLEHLKRVIYQASFIWAQ